MSLQKSEKANPKRKPRMNTISKVAASIYF